MSMKNIIKNFFYLEEEEMQEQTEKPAPQQQQPLQPVQTAQTPQPVNHSNRFKKERKSVQQPPVQVVQEVAAVPNNVVSLHQAVASKNSKVVLVEPRVYAEAQDIAENIKNRRATIVNLQRIDRDQGVRIIDFLSGTVYALGGDIQRIGKGIFLCTPDNFEITGEITDLIIDEL